MISMSWRCDIDTLLLILELSQGPRGVLEHCTFDDFQCFDFVLFSYVFSMCLGGVSTKHFNHFISFSQLFLENRFSSFEMVFEPFKVEDFQVVHFL